jgi:glycosyltransferase involved in cell wall biosynthesis
MKILWLTWKDRSHSQAGGAELVNEEIAKRLATDGHEIIFLVGKDTPTVSDTETRDGFKIIRIGGRFSVYWHAYKYYKTHLSEWPDVVIDEMNTIPFFAKFYVKQPNFMFVHQLCRQIWFYQMFFPLNVIGYFLEPLYLRLLSDRQVITVSESTKKDLMRFGFKSENISIVSEGIEIEPVADLSAVSKFKNPTILSLGSIRPMKQTLDIVRAFEIARKSLPSLELIIAGDDLGAYGEKVQKAVAESVYVGSITMKGKVSKVEKIELMQKSHLLAVTSVKEGWGLVVTEAGSQGTPSVVYDVDGLRDAVVDSGFLSGTTPADLAQTIVAALTDTTLYNAQRQSGWVKAKATTFDVGYKQFLNTISHE